MNRRKMSVDALSASAQIDPSEIRAALSGASGELPGSALTQLAGALDVDVGALVEDGEARPSVIYRSAAELQATCRPIQRDGIHFYNYYSLPAPHGEVGPVILDILCPADRLPKLNAGHLEPAITLNLGPGDIHGRWSPDATGPGWGVLEANRSADAWITGDSYIEPSYCPHAYSLASEEGARIVSYTVASGLASLLEQADHWDEARLETVTGHLETLPPERGLLAMALARRWRTAASAAESAGIPPQRLEEHLSGGTALDAGELQRLAQSLGFDHRLFLAPLDLRDELGKTSQAVAAARAGAYRYNGCELAPMAADPRIPELAGTFVRVDLDGPEGEFWDHNASHLLCTSGEVHLSWGQGGDARTLVLRPDDSVWIAACVSWRLSGRGSLARFSGSGGMTSGDLLELSNAWQPAATLRRGWRDKQDWGYE